MELRHLRYFVAAAQEEHFGRAAERLHVTRPAVSKIIGDLESELDTALFERIGHRVKLTHAGQALLPQVQCILADLKDAVTLARNVGKGRYGSLSIGYGALSLLHPLFLDAVKQFRETYPDVALSLFEIATSDQPRALAGGKIDGGFMILGPELAEPVRDGSSRLAHADTVMDWFRIENCELGIAVPLRHRLATKDSVALAELAPETFVAVSRAVGGIAYGLPVEACRQAGFEPRIGQEVGSITSQLNLVCAGMGIAVVPMGRHLDYPARLVVLPIRDLGSRVAFAFGWVRGRRSPALDRMLDIVKALAARAPVARDAPADRTSEGLLTCEPHPGGSA